MERQKGVGACFQNFYVLDWAVPFILLYLTFNKCLSKTHFSIILTVCTCLNPRNQFCIFISFTVPMLYQPYKNILPLYKVYTTS